MLYIPICFFFSSSFIQCKHLDCTYAFYTIIKFVYFFYARICSYLKRGQWIVFCLHTFLCVCMAFSELCALWSQQMHWLRTKLIFGINENVNQLANMLGIQTTTTHIPITCGTFFCSFVEFYASIPDMHYF